MFDETTNPASRRVIEDYVKTLFIQDINVRYYVFDVVFRHKYIFVNISTSGAFFALKLGDMSLLIMFYCHTKLQPDSMSSFGDFRGTKCPPPVRLRICKNMVPGDGLIFRGSENTILIISA